MLKSLKKFFAPKNPHPLVGVSKLDASKPNPLLKSSTIPVVDVDKSVQKLRASLDKKNRAISVLQEDLKIYESLGDDEVYEYTEILFKLPRLKADIATIISIISDYEEYRELLSAAEVSAAEFKEAKAFNELEYSDTAYNTVIMKADEVKSRQQAEILLDKIKGRLLNEDTLLSGSY